MNNTEFASTLLDDRFHVWHGCAGYDTRPYVLGGDVLPVSYWEGFAQNDIPDTGDVEGGDVEEFLRDLPVGAVVVLPKYSGCNYCGESRFTKSKRGQWVLSETADENGDITKVTPPSCMDIEHTSVLTEDQIRTIAEKYIGHDGVIGDHAIVPFAREILREVKSKVGVKADLDEGDIYATLFWCLFEDGLKDQNIVIFAQSLIWDLFEKEEDSYALVAEEVLRRAEQAEEELRNARMLIDRLQEQIMNIGIVLEATKTALKNCLPNSGLIPSSISDAGKGITMTKKSRGDET